MNKRVEFAVVNLAAPVTSVAIARIVREMVLRAQPDQGIIPLLSSYEGNCHVLVYHDVALAIFQTIDLIG